MADLPSTYNISIYKGDTYKRVFRLTDGAIPTPAAIDLTGCVPKAQIRVDPADVSALIDFTATLHTQSGGTLGEFEISLTHTETAGLAAAAYVWDVQLTWPDGTVKTYLAGKCVVTAEVTR